MPWGGIVLGVTSRRQVMCWHGGIAMRRILLLAVIVTPGCFWRADGYPDGRHRCDAIDRVFEQRHYDPAAHAECDPVMCLARQITVIEDDLRRDGTITVKKPDVWGNGNLMYFLQEFDRLLAGRTNEFAETLQGYVARSDQAELQSTTALAAALGSSNRGGTPVSAVATTGAVTATTEAEESGLTTSAEPINLTDYSVYELIGKAKTAAAPAQATLNVEPTELARQHATYIDVCQSLRRRHMGDDTCRAAGYGLYKFRIPVSVLPGRETSHGFAAVVTLRAQLQVDEANFKYTFPKLVVADLVELLTPVIRREWHEPLKPEEGVCKGEEGGAAKPLAPKSWLPSQAPPVGPSLIADAHRMLGDEVVNGIRGFVERQVKSSEPPQELEIRAVLFDMLAQAYGIVEKDGALGMGDECHGIYACAAADRLQRGVADMAIREKWRAAFACALTEAKGECVPWVDAGWAVALQCGILDINLKRIYEELGVRGSVSEADSAAIKDICFFHPDDLPMAAQYWQTIIRETFPLHVFAIDPQVEEQNIYDAFSRRRELQLALAYSVAKGRFNMAQKLAFSRQLALDQADIALHRTVVGFSHGEDTFGWYFYPRVQAPPTESTNIGAIIRTVWSTGPTECYDLKHRKLEPGIRECEVLIAMPSFVTDVSFDVTTNWESLSHPGVTKRSYEEMVAQGGRIHRLETGMASICESNCYRPGDVERLASRVEQLEEMLGMQTYTVRVPYEYEQSGHELFDKGNVYLRPVLTGYYGLEYLQSANGAGAYVFLTGKNFHPSLTHVIVGGSLSDSLSAVSAAPAAAAEATSKAAEATAKAAEAPAKAAEATAKAAEATVKAAEATVKAAEAPAQGTVAHAEVEVINRELLRVHVGTLNAALSAQGFQVRVGTPAGISNALRIPPAASKEAAKGWSFCEPTTLRATLDNTCCTKPTEKRKFRFFGDAQDLQLKQEPGMPQPVTMKEAFLAEICAEKEDGTQVCLGGMSHLRVEAPMDMKYAKQKWTVDGSGFRKAVEGLLEKCPPQNDDEQFTITVSGYIAVDKYPVVKVVNEIKIKVTPCPCKKTPEGPTPNGTSANSPPSSPSAIDSRAHGSPRSVDMPSAPVPEEIVPGTAGAPLPSSPADASATSRTGSPGAVNGSKLELELRTPEIPAAR